MRSRPDVSDEVPLAPPLRNPLLARAAFLVFVICAAFAATPSISAPQPGTMAAYDVSTFGGTATAMEVGGFSIMHGDGGSGIHSLQMEPSERTSEIVGLVGTPLGYDDYHLNAANVLSLEQEFGDDPESRAEAEYERVLRAIRHHRPPVELRIDSGGRSQAAMNASHRSFDRCARRLLTLAIDARIAATPEGDDDRRSWRQLRSRLGSILQPQVREATLLMRLFSMPMTPVENGYWLNFARRSLAEQRTGRRSQFDRRFEQMLAHGQEFRIEEQIRPGIRPAVAQVCDSLRPRRLPNAIRDTCTVEAVFDRRNGWPIAISLNRVQEARDRSTSNSGMIFWRVAPLEGFVAPPNLCPDV